MRSHSIGVGHRVRQRVLQMSGIKYEDVIQVFPPKGTDDTFHMRILPR